MNKLRNEALLVIPLDSHPHLGRIPVDLVHTALSLYILTGKDNKITKQIKPQ